MANHITSSQRAVAILRITLGVIILVTWWGNLNKEPYPIYTSEGIIGLFNWLFDPNGNNSQLTWYKSLLDNTILQFPGFAAIFFMITELLIGISLLFGGLTRLSAFGATLFFVNLFLANVGGHEWIWTYVLLTISALVVALSYAGREWGVDKYLASSRGNPPIDILW